MRSAGEIHPLSPSARYVSANPERGFPNPGFAFSTTPVRRCFRAGKFTTADGIKFALDAVGEKKLASNVKDMPAIAKAEEYMRKFLMDKAGNDLDSFLDDFWLYLDENSKLMEEENPAIEKLLYSLADVCKEFSCGYGKTRIRILCCI